MRSDLLNFMRLSFRIPRNIWVLVFVTATGNQAELYSTLQSDSGGTKRHASQLTPKAGAGKPKPKGESCLLSCAIKSRFFTGLGAARLTGPSSCFSSIQIASYTNPVILVQPTHPLLTRALLPTQP